MCAPTPQLAVALFDEWERLAEGERADACERMRFQLAQAAPRGRRK
jgi:hypothetical protein